MATEPPQKTWEETAWIGPHTVPGDAPDTHPGVLPDRAAWSETVPGQARRRGLCVGVDDVGLHPGVNGAATHLVLGGRVQALACRVGAPHWSGVVEHLSRLSGLAVDIGLQLDLSEHPLDPAVARSPLRWGLGAARRMPLDALRREIAAQFDAFENALGQAPHFVASLHHVHQFDGVRQAVMAEMEQRFAPGHRPWVRQGARGGRERMALGLRAWGVERCGARETAAAARAIGAHHNRGLLGVYDPTGGLARWRSLLERWLRDARDGDLLVCHPSGSSVVSDPRLAQRQAEHQLLASAEWPALVQRLDLDLQPMSRLLAGRARW